MAKVSVKTAAERRHQRRIPQAVGARNIEYVLRRDLVERLSGLLLHPLVDQARVRLVGIESRRRTKIAKWLGDAE